MVKNLPAMQETRVGFSLDKENSTLRALFLYLEASSPGKHSLGSLRCFARPLPAYGGGGAGGRGSGSTLDSFLQLVPLPWLGTWYLPPSCSRRDVRQRERPGLRSPAVAWPPSLSAGRHVARRSASLFSSHGRGLEPQDALKKDSRCLSRVAAGNPVSLDFCRGPSGTSQGASER